MNLLSFRSFPTVVIFIYLLHRVSLLLGVNSNTIVKIPVNDIYNGKEVTTVHISIKF